MHVTIWTVRNSTDWNESRQSMNLSGSSTTIGRHLDHFFFFFLGMMGVFKSIISSEFFRSDYASRSVI